MKHTTSLLAYPELIAEIHRLSSEKQSGTIFLTSHDGHLARIVLDEGRISSLVFDSKQRGYDAIALIQTIKFARIQFIDGVFETAQEVPLPNTEVLFQSLGHALEYAETAVSSSVSNFNDVLEHIKKTLATHIGPFAIIVCEEYLEEVGSIKTKDELVAMINTVALEIDNNDDRQAFKVKINNELVEQGNI